jgi:MFS family permease
MHVFPSMLDAKDGNVFTTWSLFSREEKRNIVFYIVGIMVYKFGLEAFNGSYIALATNRYDNDAKIGGYAPITFGRIGLIQGLNQAFQCIGAILVAPLVRRWPTRVVLSAAILAFAIMTTMILIVDAATGGTFKPKGAKEDDFSYYGKYNTDGMIPIFSATGIVYGMVELIRRVIPRDIVGGNVQKLRRIDATVHIFYEIAGTAGAFMTALALIPTFGNNMAFLISPFCFALAAISWYFISTSEHPSTNPPLRTVNSPKYFTTLMKSSNLFFVSIYTGGKILFTSRKFVWLLPSYAIAFYSHRYLENGIAPIIARRYMGNSAWSQIMVGGSNFGELLGALFVFLFTNVIKTPMPWLRMDALALLIVWYLAFWYPSYDNVGQAWVVAATFMPISFGWAAGDVSLAAYIQAMLHRQENGFSNVSALVTVMAFLYSTYIIVYSIASPLLGTYVDNVSAKNNGDVHEAMFNIAGVQFTIISITVLCATFIPHGAFAFNPDMLERQNLEDDETAPRNLADSLKGLKDDDQWKI